jgi:hypothetical protein
MAPKDKEIEKFGSAMTKITSVSQDESKRHVNRDNGVKGGTSDR